MVGVSPLRKFLIWPLKANREFLFCPYDGYRIMPTDFELLFIVVRWIPYWDAEENIYVGNSELLPEKVRGLRIWTPDGFSYKLNVQKVRPHVKLHCSSHVYAFSPSSCLTCANQILHGIIWWYHFHAAIPAVAVHFVLAVTLVGWSNVFFL
jgi:hypothetical protein